MTPHVPPTSCKTIEERVGVAGLLEGSGRGAEAAAAPPPPRRGSRSERVAAQARSRISPCSSSGPRPASRSPTISARALDDLVRAGRRRRNQEDARRRARPQERHHHHPSGRRRHRVAGLGRDAAAHVRPLGRAQGLQARGDRPPAGRRGRHQERDADDHRRLRLRHAARRGRRAPAGAHLALRPGVAPPHVVRVALRLARAARGRRRRDRREGPARRHLPLERRRRPARQRHRFGRPHHAPPDRHRRVVPERALAAQEPRARR